MTLPTLQEAEEYMVLMREASNWADSRLVHVWAYALSPNQHRLIYRCERQLFGEGER